MKKITISLFKFVSVIIIACVFGFIIGSIGLCRLFHTGCPAPVNPVDSVNMHDFVPRSTAHKWTKSYDSLWTIMGNGVPVPLKYFTVRSQDLLCAMGIDTAWQYQTAHRYIRLTIGYSDSLKQLKAYIQPVVDADITSKSSPFPAGRALFFNKKGQIVDSLGNRIDKNGHIIQSNSMPDSLALFVGDLNTPCPATCGN
ncbi:hypothetical protein BEL04_11675 [Mucilaginibacter sp. PPCGB 2223]|uniref:hypothetical protein n=1 Tax=Mucilaginibacter sp. PPCGB 2223 TaxID=1886027 RepID=UPI0008247D7A|nr:hypothetical protein [Mucilaginibacter sp. PPCGB 2223]OCX52145.1 hypothetical protein BEL04_11675 [Mucilaginibacter sp. PPCGB 2223]